MSDTHLSISCGNRGVIMSSYSQLYNIISALPKISESCHFSTLSENYRSISEFGVRGDEVSFCKRFLKMLKTVQGEIKLV